MPLTLCTHCCFKIANTPTPPPPHCMILYLLMVPNQLRWLISWISFEDKFLKLIDRNSSKSQSYLRILRIYYNAGNQRPNFLVTCYQHILMRTTFKIYRRFLILSHDNLSLAILNNKTFEHCQLKVMFIAMLWWIQVKLILGVSSLQTLSDSGKKCYEFL